MLGFWARFSPRRVGDTCTFKYNIGVTYFEDKLLSSVENFLLKMREIRWKQLIAPCIEISIMMFTFVQSTQERLSRLQSLLNCWMIVTSGGTISVVVPRNCVRIIWRVKIHLEGRAARRGALGEISPSLWEDQQKHGDCSRSPTPQSGCRAGISNIEDFRNIRLK